MTEQAVRPAVSTGTQIPVVRVLRKRYASLQAVDSVSLAVRPFSWE